MAKLLFSASGMAVIILQRKILHLMEHIPSDIINDFLCGLHHGLGIAKGGKDADQINHSGDGYADD